MSRAALSTALSPARTTVWSSASTTRIDPSLMFRYPVAGCGVRRERHGGNDARTRFRSALHLEAAARQRYPLAHREQAHPGPPTLGVGNVEAATVVDDLQQRPWIGAPVPVGWRR